MPVYASFDCSSYNPHLTCGKRYKVLEETSSGGGFAFRNDVAEPTIAYWQGARILNGGDWTRHEEPDAPASDAKPSKVSRYVAHIAPPPNRPSVPEVVIEDVLDYRHAGGGVFYVAGTDFEQWFLLEPGQTVTVTEQE